MLLLILFGVSSVIFVFLYLYYSQPMNYVVRLGELGFHFDPKDQKGTYRERQLERVKRLRKVGELPPVYPNGWFCIAESNEVREKGIKAVVVFGEQLSLVRAEDGYVHLIDSYCPHLGANLSVGGKVVNNNCVQCPFHGWVFSAETGKCVRIPYDSGTIPEQAKISTWPVLERNHHIYVWYHCDGLEPQWEIPEIEEVMNGDWKYRGRTEHELLCHCQEIPENGADLAHLNYLHLQIPQAGSDVFELKLTNPSPRLYHYWDGGWEARTGDEAHISVMKLQQVMMIGKTQLPLTASLLHAHQIGPGIVYMHFDFGFWGKAIVFHHVTPEEPLFQRARFVMYGATNPVFSRFFINSEALQFERDVYIWSNKRFLKSPLLVKNDGPVQKHRRWYSQFYTEKSPRLLPNGTVSNQVKSVLDW
ncbi:unnamed protein product, partial [Mesorhabditis belari]|uniref:cholesterol 7-desaturase n=1 Tax=Mesorhabditis belari TaxID=2138241 RepID=A0AAF3J5E3_9BILA